MRAHINIDNNMNHQVTTKWDLPPWFPSDKLQTQTNTID